MAKLRCSDHDRRVAVTDDGTVLHRGVGKRTERCETDTVVIGGNAYNVAFFRGRTDEDRPMGKRLLRDLFAFGDLAQRDKYIYIEGGE